MNEIQINYLDKETKRFLAATAALQGLIASDAWGDDAKGLVENAVGVADDLLAELDKKK